MAVTATGALSPAPAATALEGCASGTAEGSMGFMCRRDVNVEVGISEKCQIWAQNFGK